MYAIPRIVFLAAVLTIWLPYGAGASRAPDDHAHIVTHGLRITLHVGRPSYPANALVRATLVIRNVTHHQISIMFGQNSPRVVVVDSSGREVYSPATPLGNLTLIYPEGPGPSYFKLGAGQSYRVGQYAILRGSELRAQVVIASLAHPSEIDIARPRLRVRLTAAGAPKDVVSASPLRATIVARVRETGPMIWKGEDQCVTGRGDTYATGSGWTSTRGDVVVPDPSLPTDCATYTWHAIAGWLNHPVATIVYSSRL